MSVNLDDLPTRSTSRPPLSLRSPSGIATGGGSTSSGASTPIAKSPFGAVKSSISRKKPLGLDISRSIKPSRTDTAIISGPDSSGGDGRDTIIIPEADRLRDEIARLQLSSRSSSSSYASGPESPPGLSPITHSTPNPPPRPPRRQTTSGVASLSTPVTTPGSSSTSSRKQSKTNGSHRKKRKDDDDAVKDEDLEMLGDLGAGNGGTVTKVWDKKRKCVIARKLILVDAKPSVRKQILRELQIMKDCSSPYIVEYYGCFPVDVHVGIVMEYMDVGSFDFIYRNTGAIEIDIVGKVAEAVLRGLVYLYDVHRIIHRDIKPSNILANTRGQIKICDFGVSTELVNSIANTFVGTSTYMSPERIQGAQYTIKSDVWSLGISLVELAQGRFPFADPIDESGDEGPDDHTLNADATLPRSSQPPDLSPTKKRHRKRGVSLGGGGMTMAILDLLQHIVNEPAPRLVSTPHRTFPRNAQEFVENCLDKDPSMRKTPQELLQSDWIQKLTVTPDELRTWAQDVAKVVASPA